MRAVALPLLALLVGQPLAREDVLEPSVENEVAHALARAADLTPPPPTNTAAVVRFVRLYETNGLSATARAIRLVSTQGADGRWREGTNDVSFAAREILKRLSGDYDEIALPQ